jgi:acetyl/propionyl-CoA carboxylase alpha subunit
MIKLARILVATRGTMARRLIRHYRAIGVETAAAFSEPDAELGYLDDADYAVFLNGRTVADTYLNAGRVVEAAMDAGCEAVHPGNCFLADHVDLYDLANKSNLAVIGADVRSLVGAGDRVRLRRVARELGIPALPGTDAIPEGSDGLDHAAAIGAPLFVKSGRGRCSVRVARLEDVPAAVEEVRTAARLLTGDPGVYLERAVEGLRQVGVPVVVDRRGTAVALGSSESVLEHPGWRTGIEEFGTGLRPIQPGIEEASIRLARALAWVGVGRVRWAVSDAGTWFLLGFSARLTTGFDLWEAVHGIDLLDAQWRALTGEALGWESAEARRHGIQLRLLHLDPATGARPPGILEKLMLPDLTNASVELGGADEGMPLSEDTDPILAKLTFVADSREEVLAAAQSALAAVEVDGVATNLAALRAALEGSHRPAEIAEA